MTVAIQVGGAALGTLAPLGWRVRKRSLAAFRTHAPCARPAMAWLPVGIGAALFNAAPIPTLCVARLLRPAGVRALPWVEAGHRISDRRFAPVLQRGVHPGGPQAGPDRRFPGSSVESPMHRPRPRRP